MNFFVVKYSFASLTSYVYSTYTYICSNSGAIYQCSNNILLFGSVQFALALSTKVKLDIEKAYHLLMVVVIDLTFSKSLKWAYLKLT